MLTTQQNIIGELQSAKFAEEGTSGLEVWAGFVQQAYNSELYWPACIPLYDRLWRSDPEVTISRLVFEAMTSKLDVTFDLDPQVDSPTPDDQAAVDFGNEVLDDIEGGVIKWLINCMTRVPFYGWGWWEVVPGVRSPDWRPPQQDPWRSKYDDGRIGYRRLAFRYYSSFDKWEITEDTARLLGMWQFDPPNPSTLIPLERSLHCTFGDSDNPEGLATFEALWRLERIKYGLEQIMSIGFEHSAGYLNVKATKKLTGEDNATIKKAARAILTAHEGNFAAWPEHLEGEVMNVDYSAAGAIIDAIRYMGILKMALFGMQWAALGVLSPYGSYSSMKDANEFFLAIFNSMAEGFVNQADQQIGARLFDYPVNAEAFPNMTRRPKLTVTRAQKIIDLTELAQFVTAFATIFPMGDDDVIAIRRKSDFLPEVLPEVDMVEAPDEKAEEMPEEEAEESVTPEGSPEEEEGTEETGDTGIEEMLRHEYMRWSDMQANNDNSAILMLRPPEDVCKTLAWEGGEPVDALHLTLAFLEDGTAGDKKAAFRAAMRAASQLDVLEADITGYGLFNPNDNPAHVLLINSPQFPEFRRRIVRTLEMEGIPVSAQYGFIPHITLKYGGDAPEKKFKNASWTFENLILVWGDECYSFPLVGGQVEISAQESLKMVTEMITPADVDGPPITISEPPWANEKDINRAMRGFKKWAEENRPDLANILKAKVIDTEEG